MPRFVVEIKETRTYKLVVEADDEDEAYELACEQFPDGYVSDQFDSFERHAVYVSE